MVKHRIWQVVQWEVLVWQGILRVDWLGGSFRDESAEVRWDVKVIRWECMIPFELTEVYRYETWIRYQSPVLKVFQEQIPYRSSVI